jgi:hypothetical protein
MQTAGSTLEKEPSASNVLAANAEHFCVDSIAIQRFNEKSARSENTGRHTNQRQLLIAKNPGFLVKSNGRFW